MRRRLFNFLTALSLLLCVAAIVAWVATSRGSRWWRLQAAPGRAHFLVCGHAMLYFVTQRADLPRDGSWVPDVREPGKLTIRAGDARLAEVSFDSNAMFTTSPGITHFRVAGPSVGFPTKAGGTVFCTMSTRGFGVSFLLLAAAAAAPTAARIALPRLRRARQRERTARGLCPSCGYDLAGNVSGVCPECGQRQ